MLVITHTHTHTHIYIYIYIYIYIHIFSTSRASLAMQTELDGLSVHSDLSGSIAELSKKESEGASVALEKEVKEHSNTKETLRVLHSRMQEVLFDHIYN